jgi:D-serine dehydratase
MSSNDGLARDSQDFMIAPLHKGLGHLDRAASRAEAARRGWNLLREELSLPVAVLYEDRLQHNLAWMGQFIAAYGLRLAPHGKTTMAPALFARQLRHGAWGITLATPQQTRVAYEHGVRRILMANQLVGRENMAVVSRLLADTELEFYCLIDSADQVQQLGEFFGARGQRLRVLLELGVMGGRAGVRDERQEKDVLAALARWRDSLALCGVELYEGVLEEEGAIREFLARAVALAGRLAREGHFERRPFLLSGAGSAWYDVVAEVFSQAELVGDAEIILRPGCYLTHDAGIYREAQEKILRRNPVARRMHSGLKPALQIWAYVQSRPEPQKAIIAMGKRDVAFDAGLPVPALHFRPGRGEPRRAPGHWALSKMMDQHAYLQCAAEDDLRVGDMVAFDISHPCLTFDKWRVIPVLDAAYQVVDVVQTFF